MVTVATSTMPHIQAAWDACPTRRLQGEREYLIRYVYREIQADTESEPEYSASSTVVQYIPNTVHTDHMVHMGHMNHMGRTNTVSPTHPLAKVLMAQKHCRQPTDTAGNQQTLQVHCLSVSLPLDMSSTFTYILSSAEKHVCGCTTD